MSESKASRTLLKSPPELWSEVSTATSLQRHMDQFGEIRITKLEPETAVAWEGEHARGTITLEVSAWGTKVSLTAEPVGTDGVDGTEPEPADPVEAEPADLVTPDPVVDRIEPEAAGDRVEPEAFNDRVEPMQTPRWTQRLAMTFRKWFSPPPLQDADPVVHAPEPEPDQPAPPHSPIVAPEPAARREPPPQLDDESRAALDAALDSLGQAHHRPFSRA